MSKLPMTRKGHAKLINDLKNMQGPEMQEILRNLADAREKGDISENAEYEVAKEQYDNLQKRISSLAEKLSNSVIIEKDLVSTDVVQILTTVKLHNIKTGKEQIFTIVPETEIDVKNGKISFSSPIGKGLIGKAVGEITKIKVPAGELEFEIIEITA
jgi:transcription elongation factor GreA